MILPKDNVLLVEDLMTSTEEVNLTLSKQFKMKMQK